MGVTREVGGNPGTSRVLEAKTEAQGTAVRVRCCPEVKAARARMWQPGGQLAGCW